MKFFLFLLSLIALQPVLATNYYFSDISGNDSYTSAQARNPATPWKSINKLNTFTLSAGDSVLFKKGETFYGSIKMTAVGQANNPITYSSYGSGANPVITGFSTITGWTLYGGRIFYASLDVTNLNIVSINGMVKGMGRYPNSGYLNYESHSNNTAITDNQLSASPSWTGGEAVIRKYRWILDRQKITSHSAQTLVYSANNFYGNNSSYIPQDGNGYFIQNHLGTLDQDGEWYYDVQAKRLYVYFASGQPANYQVKASTKDNNMAMSTNSYINFLNMDFEGANTYGISLISSSNITIRNCNFSKQGGVAIYGGTVNYVTVQGGSIANALSNGIYFEYEANNSTIDGVTVTNTNTIAGSGRSGDFVGNGIGIVGDNTVITNNRVFNSGYNGIFFMGNNVLVEHNYVDTFCVVKDDGAGIYTYTGNPSVVNSNRKVKNNVVLNAVGAYAGCEAYDYEAFGKAAGIYLDDYANHVEITNNTFANGSWGGVFLHNTRDIVLSDNLVYNHAHQFHIIDDLAPTRNLTLNGNQFISKAASQHASYFLAYVPNDPSLTGTFNNNYYARPIDDNATMLVNKEYTNGGGAVLMPLSQWKTNYSLDINSQKSPVSFTADPDNNIRFEYNETNVAKTIALNGSYVDVKNTPYSNTITLQPYSSILLLRSQSIAKVNQTITFPAIAAKTNGAAPFAISATASSALPVSFRVVSGPAVISGSTVTLNATGTVTIEASQAGNTTYNPAVAVTQSFAVTGAADNIAPVIVPKNITVQTGANGQAIITAADVIASITDNTAVDNASIQISQTQFNCAAVSTASNAATHQAYNAGVTTGVQNFGGELGMLFNVNNANGIVISQLGAFDHQGNGITGTQNGGVRVAIFNRTTKTIVAGLDVVISGMADGISGNHRIKNITPVTLPAGQYIVVAKGYNQNELAGNSSLGSPIAFGDVANGAISYVLSQVLYGSEASAFAYPTNNGYGPGYLAGTFIYSVAQNTTATTTNNSATHQAYTASVTTGVQNFGGELGMLFNVNNANGVVINQLGAFDHNGDGVFGTQNGGVRVAIFNRATKTIVPGLDAIIIGNADGYNGNHRMKNITPVTLPAGQYIVVAKGYNENELAGNSSLGSPIAFGDVANGAISYVLSQVLYGSEGSAFAYPANNGYGPGYLAGTFAYSLTQSTTTTTTNTTTHQAYTTSATTGVQNFGGELGMVFKVNNATGITIDQLGAFDHQGNGITGTQNGGIRVAIFNKTTQTIVPGLDAVITGMADGLNGNHRMKRIAPVTLLPGEYVVVSKGYNQNELNGNRGMGSAVTAGDTDNGAITFVASAFYGSEGSGFNYPANPDGAQVYLAGTFTYQTLSTSSTNTTSNNVNTVTITAKDIYGNVATATATVTVICNQGATQRVALTSDESASTQLLPLTKDATGITANVLNIFPNPTTGRFTVQLSNLKVPQIAIEILSENGAIVNRKTATTIASSSMKMDFDLSNQPSGMYFVRVVGAEGIKIGKVIVQH